MCNKCYFLLYCNVNGSPILYYNFKPFLINRQKAVGGYFLPHFARVILGCHLHYKERLFTVSRQRNSSNCNHLPGNKPILTAAYREEGIIQYTR